MTESHQSVDDSALPTQYLVRPEGSRVAYRHLTGKSPTVVFLSGYASDMGGTKARYLQNRCRQWGQAYLCLDYRGHGLSDERFVDGTIGDWFDDARRVIEHASEGPLVLVGSSMGGWIMLLLARELAHRVAGLVGIAAAPDFTHDLMPARLTQVQREALERDGIAQTPNQYGPEPGIVTAKLLAEGAIHRLLHEPLTINCPVYLLHGLSDPDVPWQRALAIAECVTSQQVTINLLKGAGHRLSSPDELALIARHVAAAAGVAGVAD